MSQPDDGSHRGVPPAPGPPPAGWAPAGWTSAGYAPVPYDGPPPGYGQGYGPPTGYGTPAGYGQPAFAVHRPTNTTAVLALVFAFVFAPAGLVLGIVARRQIRRTGEGGDGLALAGIVVGGIASALYTALVAVWVWAFVSLTSTL